MKNENQLLQEISYLITIFESAFLLLHGDKFHHDEAQMKKLYASKKISEELDEKKIDIIFMQLANEGFKEIVFNDLLTKISKYDDLVFEKKIITNNTFLNSYFDKIPELIKIQQWIKIKENDILEVEESQSGMPQLEKQKVISDFEIELNHLKKEQEMIYSKYSWIKTNYYFKILTKADEILEKIENYFEVSVLKPANEIFDSEITRKIFDKMVEKKYIYPKSQLTHEDFHLILNLKMPKKNHLKILKTTLFANIFRLLSDNIEKKGFGSKEWKSFVIEEFNLRESTLNRKYSQKHKDFKIFYEIINEKTVNNGQ